MTNGDVRAEVAYVNDEWRDSEEPPRIYSGESRRANTSYRTVDIADARQAYQDRSLSLDREGFQLVNHASSFTQFDDRDQVLSTYFAEMEALLLEVTGATAAFPFPFYQVRSADPEHFFDAYSLYMHCDYSLSSCIPFAQSIIRRARRQESYPPEAWDFAFFNLWRAVDAPVERDPLVWIAADSLDLTDVIDYRPVRDAAEGLAALPLFNEQQRLYYFPNLEPHEVLVLKQLDSRDHVAQVCPHTSFVDPNSRADARPRRSIDVRFLCMFPKGD